ncbi:hypothetical protein [Frateuria defendens]|nr:hypothetical protein [Frateuria defendens]
MGAARGMPEMLYPFCMRRISVCLAGGQLHRKAGAAGNEKRPKPPGMRH